VKQEMFLILSAIIAEFADAKIKQGSILGDPFWGIPFLGIQFGGFTEAQFNRDCTVECGTRKC